VFGRPSCVPSTIRTHPLQACDTPRRWQNTSLPGCLSVEDPLLTVALDLGTGVHWTPEITEREVATFVSHDRRFADGHLVVTEPNGGRVVAKHVAVQRASCARVVATTIDEVDAIAR
jgi:hypothetical protein